jgi:hypothetical protein
MKTITLDIRTVEALCRSACWPVLVAEDCSNHPTKRDGERDETACLARVTKIQEQLEALVSAAEIKARAKAHAQTKNIFFNALDFAEALDELVTGKTDAPSEPKELEAAHV